MKFAIRSLPIVLAALAGFAGMRREPQRAPQARRRSWVKRSIVTLGVVGMIGGASMISVGLYDYLDSSEASVPREPAVLAHRNDPGGVYDRPVGIVTPTPKPTPEPTQEPTATPEPEPGPGYAAPPPPLRDQPYRMVIDKIGVNAGVFTYGLDANQVPEVPLNAWDVAWYDFSAQPGTGSNAVFAAHVTWSGPAVFYHLDALLPGDEVTLVGDDGTRLTYTVTESYLVDPNDPASLQVMHGTDKDMITLITCGGSFFYTGDPVFGGDYTNRQIVRGVLQEVAEA